tara:strand:- start:1597 stop:2106 length:510 start_codon:yes stop_codon:yes gene_type:complete
LNFAEIDTSLIFATGSTLVAALAAYFSYRSAKATLYAYEAHLISDYAEKYAAPAFLSHLRALRKWSDRETGGSAADFVPLLSSGDAFAAEVDSARRAIKMHYESVGRLGRARYLRRRAVREICSSAGLDLYFDVAIPLTKELNPGLDVSIAKYLAGLGLKRQTEIRSLS